MPITLSALQIANLIAFTACFGSFIWAIKYHFRTVDKVPFGTRVIQVVGGFFTLVHLVALLQPDSAQGLKAVAALLLYCSSFGLFWACVRVNRSQPFSLAFSVDEPQHLMARGPYRFVRHPFYASYSLGWLAGIVASAQPWLWLSLLVMGAIYYRAAALEERKFRHSGLAASYRAYQRRTGMFVPRLWPNATATASKESV